MARKGIDAATQPIGQPGVVELPSDGEAALIRPDIQIVDGPFWKKKADELAFMNEIVEVIVHTTSEKDAENPVPAMNGGKAEYFIRGVPKKVKRKYVEVLARAKHEGYVDQEYTNNDGVRGHRYPKSVSLKYPFHVTEDPNPRGAAWLKKILAEAA